MFISPEKYHLFLVWYRKQKALLTLPLFLAKKQTSPTTKAMRMITTRIIMPEGGNTKTEVSRIIQVN